MAERFVGIDVALRAHRIAVLDRDGEAVGPSFTIAASTDGVATLLRTLAARAATAAQTLIGLEASGHLWENLEAALVGAGYRVIVLNPLQTRRYRDVVRRKAKTDDIDAHVIAGLLRSGAAQASYVPDEQIQSLRELARLRARLMADRQDYLRQLVAQLDVVLPEHRTVLGDLLTARARGILAQFPTAPHLANANPRAIRRAAENAGARGFSLDDATGVRDRARRSLYSGKAAAARAHVVRTLVSQLERLTSAIDEVDRAATTLLPPSEPGTGPSDAELLQTIPGIGPQTAATLLGELGAFTRFIDARALVAYVGFYPVFALPRRRQCRAPQWRVAHHLSPQEGPGQNGQASPGRGCRQAPSCGVRHAQTPAALQPLTSPRRAGDDWVLTSHGMSRLRMAVGESS